MGTTAADGCILQIHACVPLAATRDLTFIPNVALMAFIVSAAVEQIFVAMVKSATSWNLLTKSMITVTCATLGTIFSLAQGYSAK
ncbi:hypothetical protein BOTCAL_0471g00050 [Botryotinia calthae]|uniref:Uncharacterized protein n=1 Tax=Botryotinia calthae TaxID=38488 RepID=A0A4Y8CN16_9HELO|nr:hypothetical protein BOTCAL_0471g00050 [Botryotinia calthae]